MNNKGQSILSEYVMIFFVVIAAATAMTTYLQRGFEARIHDARNFAVSSVISSNACDANCLQATGGSIAHEYEPYYTVTGAIVGQNAQDTVALTPGSAQETGSKYVKSSKEATQTIANSIQLPACADGSNGMVLGNGSC